MNDMGRADPEKPDPSSDKEDWENGESSRKEIHMREMRSGGYRDAWRQRDRYLLRSAHGAEEIGQLRRGKYRSRR